MRLGTKCFQEISLFLNISLNTRSREVGTPQFRQCHDYENAFFEIRSFGALPHLSELHCRSDLERLFWHGLTENLKKLVTFQWRIICSYKILSEL